MPKIKVLMLVPNLQVANGVASFVMNYLRNLNHDVIQMDVASYQEGASPYYSEVKQYGGEVYFLTNIRNLSTHLKTCNQILSEGQYDVIHDNTLHVSIPMMWCAQKRGIAVRILHSHNSKMGETRIKELRNEIFRPVLCSLATDYITCSQMAGEVLFKRRKYEMLPNVIRTEIYSFDALKRSEIRKKMGAQNKFVIGTVGRLAEQKNPFFAIDVFKKLHDEMPDTEYWWIGSGGLDNRVKEYVESYRASDYIKLLGSRSDVLELYQAMDCFFLPSLFEGLPVTGVEAQAMGLPMVVSDTVTKEMVYTDLVDYVGLNESVEVWAEHLKNALDRHVDRACYSDMLTRSVFSDAGCGDRLTNLYRKLLHKHGGK